MGFTTQLSGTDSHVPAGKGIPSSGVKLLFDTVSSILSARVGNDDADDRRECVFESFAFSELLTSVGDFVSLCEGGEYMGRKSISHKV